MSGLDNISQCPVQKSSKPETGVFIAGPVRLLVNPPTAGYAENPIVVYYCYSDSNSLELCIAVVQNTPWAASVTFAFRPDGESVPKALHVSPFMDMGNNW